MEEKKESWQEKLWNLLNDYEDYKEKECWYANYDWRLHEISDGEEWIEQRITAFRVDESELWEEESIAVIICKGYMFIQWLVENDKIDIVKVYENLTNYEIEIRIRAVKELLENNEEDTIAYLKLLMLLSISDTPIDDLISYLR